MEFVCVMSIEGSLASFIVQQVNTSHYLARLKKTSLTQPEALPEALELQKQENGWIYPKKFEGICKNLIRCIEWRMQALG